MTSRVSAGVLLLVVMAGLYLTYSTFTTEGAYDLFLSDKTMPMIGVVVFGVAGMAAMASRSRLLKVLGRLLFMGCFYMGIMIWASWNTGSDLAHALDSIAELDDTFAEVGEALSSVGTESRGAPVTSPLLGGVQIPSAVTGSIGGEADDVVARLVGLGGEAVGRRCIESASGAALEQTWFMWDAAGATVVVELNDRRAPDGSWHLDPPIVAVMSAESTPLMPFTAACAR